MINLKKMRKPSKISILGQEIKIVYKDILDDNCCGLFHPDTMDIEIKKDKYWRSTLIHEIIHAILCISGATELVTDKIEEALVCAIESGLKDIITLKYKPKT